MSGSEIRSDPIGMTSNCFYEWHIEHNSKPGKIIAERLRISQISRFASIPQVNREENSRSSKTAPGSRSGFRPH